MVVILGVVGAVVLYASITGKDPRDLFKQALGKK